MCCNWPLVRLGNHVHKIGSGSTPRGGASVYLKTATVSLIRSQNVYNDGFWPEGLVYISDAEAARLQGVEVNEGDILLNITGDSVARVCLAPRNYLPARVNQHVAIIRVDPNDFDSRFVRYFIASRSTQEFLLALASSGATRNALTKGMLEKLEIPKPPIVEQQGIADVLAVLDEKIMSNNRVTGILERITDLVFHAWFVDFLPVRAKAAAGAEGLDPLRAAMCALGGNDEAALAAMPRKQYEQLAATAALFPDQLTSSELGRIPRDWDIRGLHNLAALQTSSVAPAKQPDEYFEHYSIPAFDERALPTIEVGSAIKSSKYIVAHSAVLVSKLNPETPRVWLPNAKTSRAVCSTEFMQFVPRHEYGRAYLYLMMKSERMRMEILKRVTGSTGSRQRAQPSQISVLPIVYPPRELVIAFESIVSPILEMVAANREQCGTLASVRDMLLPKLLSGEIRVREAQELVEATA